MSKNKPTSAIGRSASDGKKVVKNSLKKKAGAKKKAAKKETSAKSKKENTPTVSVPKTTVKKKNSPKTGAQGFQLLRGFKDVLPKDEKFWRRLYESAASLADAYNYDLIETPVLEEARLFIRSIGKGTDVVDKEMYMFEDRDGSKVALRPEFTASIARSYITHGMHIKSQPVKFWSYGPLFRHDRPQAGRFREFHQFNCEVFGLREPEIDAELIVVGYNFLRDLGINTHVHINSIGSPEDRQNYLIELVAYLRSKRSYLSDLSKKRINKNPLRVLDSKEEQDREVLEEAPQILDWLSKESKDHFMKVLEFLDELEIPYVLQPTLVRGLDYYTDTVFEFYQEMQEGGSQSALGGGGRYDLLVEQLGGQPTPGSGFALGLERIMMIMRKMEEEGKDMSYTRKRPIFFAQLGEQARQQALRLVEELRREGIYVYHKLGKPSLKAQLELANKFNVSHTVILGQKEMQDGTFILRDMDSGIQEIIDQANLVKELKKIKRK